MRGYFGIVVSQSKSPENVGGILRSAHSFGAAFVMLDRPRFPVERARMATDTSKAAKHMPLFVYDGEEEWRDAISSLQGGPSIIAVERREDISGCMSLSPGVVPKDLAKFSHPEMAVYLLGAEDRGLSVGQIVDSEHQVYIDARYSLNLCSAASIVMWSRTQGE